MTFIYKICRRAEWEEAVRSGAYRGSEVDHRDGFIHLSAADQLRETARRHFAGQTDLILVAFAADELAPHLKWEPSRGGALFPHLYAPLPPARACACTLLPLEGDHHRFPEGIPE